MTYFTLSSSLRILFVALSVFLFQLQCLSCLRERFMQAIWYWSKKWLTTSQWEIFSKASLPFTFIFLLSAFPLCTYIFLYQPAILTSFKNKNGPTIYLILEVEVNLLVIIFERFRYSKNTNFCRIFKLVNCLVLFSTHHNFFSTIRGSMRMSLGINLCIFCNPSSWCILKEVCKGDCSSLQKDQCHSIDTTLMLLLWKDFCLYIILYTNKLHFPLFHSLIQIK